VTDRPRRRLGLDLTPLRTSRDYRLVFLGGSVSGFGSRLGVGGSIWVGGVLCIVGTAALAAALPRFLRYDGKNGMARKRAEDEAWIAAATARTASTRTP
jgi:urocanate hydratase